MKYTKEERIEIGSRVYNNEMTVREAAENYDVVTSSIDNYVREYRETNNLPPRSNGNNPHRDSFVRISSGSSVGLSNAKIKSIPNYDEYASMSREELLRELILSKINEARAKKGYVVKGDGAQKVFEPIEKKNTK